MSFGAGAVGGIAAYSLMSHMSSGYRPGPGYYRSGYGSKGSFKMNVSANGSFFSWRDVHEQ